MAILPLESSRWSSRREATAQAKAYGKLAGAVIAHLPDSTFAMYRKLPKEDQRLLLGALRRDLATKIIAGHEDLVTPELQKIGIERISLYLDQGIEEIHAQNAVKMQKMSEEAAAIHRHRNRLLPLHRFIWATETAIPRIAKIGILGSGLAFGAIELKNCASQPAPDVTHSDPITEPHKTHWSSTKNSMSWQDSVKHSQKVQAEQAKGK